MASAPPLRPPRHSRPRARAGSLSATRKDDWLNQIPGKHRYIFDAPNPEGFASALQFLNNYFNINQNDYGLKDGDLAVVLIARHLSTAFGYRLPG